MNDNKAEKTTSIIFVSNFFNHHQQPFSEAMYELYGENYSFIETSEISDVRIKMGMNMPSLPSYAISMEEFVHNRAIYEEMIDNADVVIYGSAPYALVKKRIYENKLTFRYSERPLKKGLEIWKYPIRFIRWHRRYPNSKQVHLLCASAYTAADYAKLGLFKRKAYKWGYFPEIKKYEDIQSLIAAKKARTLLWAGRLIDWKHPEMALEVASKLKAEGYDFRLDIIGNGDMESLLNDRIATEGLGDCVHMLGSMQPEQVREHMERSEIFLFTSDRQEGWGAVLNESMNSACAVVASHAIGSVPFLIENGRNGLIYKDGNLDDLYQKVKWLLDYSEERKEIAKNAYTTMTEQWNAENAAERFIALSEAILDGDKNPELFSNGVCSTAEKLHDNWF